MLFETQYVPNKQDILSIHDQTHEDVERFDVFHEGTRIHVFTLPEAMWRAHKLPEGLRPPYVVVTMAPLDAYDFDPRAIVHRSLPQPPRRVLENPLETLALSARGSRSKKSHGKKLTSSTSASTAEGETESGACSDGEKPHTPRMPKGPRRKKHQSPQRDDVTSSPPSDPSSTPSTPKRSHSGSEKLAAGDDDTHVHRHKHPHADARHKLGRPRGGSDANVSGSQMRHSDDGTSMPAIILGDVVAAATATSTGPSEAVAATAATPATETPPAAAKSDIGPYQNDLTRGLGDLAEFADHDVLRNAAGVVVYLNHLDVYWQKARHADIRCSFPDYTGGNDPRRALDYILSQFDSKLKAKDRSFRHQVISACSLDDEQMTSHVVPAILDALTAAAKPAEKGKEKDKPATTTAAAAAVADAPAVVVPAEAQPAAAASAAAAEKKPVTPKEVTRKAPSSTESKKLKVKSGAVSEIGRRASNEDTHLLMEDVREGLYAGKDKLHFYAVYDGHGGTATSEAAVKHVHRCILTDPEFAAGNTEAAITNGYVKADTDMAVPGDKSGSTAVTALIHGKMLYVANVGDSEAVLGFRETPKAPIQHALLTRKHIPTDRAEKERVTSLGAMVVFGRLFGTLAVSRAFGDREFKDPARMFVTAEPYITVRPLTRTDQFLVVACDGLWDKVSYQEAVDLVMAHRDSGRNPEECAQALAKMSLDRGSMDNVTVIVVFFTWG